MNTALSAHLGDRTIIEIDGADSRVFLQGLISNNIDNLTNETPIYAALLTPQGKFLFDFILIARDDIIWMDCDADTAPQLIQRLTMYKMRAAVSLTLRSDLAVVGVWLGHLDLPDPWVTIIDPRVALLGDRSIGPASDLSSLTINADLAAYEHHRIETAVPKAGIDLIAQKSILLECNFEELHGVSFNKGCFVGQELTARTKHRALIKKRLMPVNIKGPAIEPGTIIRNEGKDAGEMRSQSGNSGLALLRLERLGGPLDADGTMIELRQVDWLPMDLFKPGPR